MKNIHKFIRLLIVPVLCFALFSCGKEHYDPNPSEGDYVYIISIKVKVGNLELQGKINEIKKEIIFPKLPGNANLSAVSFSGELPPGAVFEKNAYDFTPDEGNSFAKKTIKIVNNKRFREYYVTLTLSVPPVGADFLNPKVYNFSSGSGGTRYLPFMNVAQGRVADIDKNHVLIVTRVGDFVPHLLRLSDLKNGITDNKIPLKLEGVTGGTYAVNAGRLINGHVYICNLTTGFGSSAFKVYHWNTATPDDPPTVVANYIRENCAGPTGGDRYGDYFSIDLDQNGNGYIISKAGSSHATQLRIKVENFTTSSEPTIIAITESGTTPSNGAWGTCNMVEGNPDEFLFTSSNNVVRLINANGATMYNMTTFPVNDGGGARIFTFNNGRYLLTLNNMIGAGIISIYDITKGASTTEALQIFDGGDAIAKAPLFQFSLGGAIPSGNVSCGVNFCKDGEKLYVLGSGALAGFAVVEFGYATDIDPFDSIGEKDGYVIRVAH